MISAYNVIFQPRASVQNTDGKGFGSIASAMTSFAFRHFVCITGSTLDRFGTFYMTHYFGVRIITFFLTW